MNMYFIREHNLSLFHLRLRETPDLDLLNCTGSGFLDKSAA